MVMFIENSESPGHNGHNQPLENQQLKKMNDIQTLVKMKKDSLSSQKLSFIPFSYFVTNNHLTELSLSDNYLRDLPDSIRQLQLLQDLDLSLNKFEETPDVICELINLKKLNLSENVLQKLSPKLGNLENLEILDLSNNKLKNLPESCRKMQKIKSLNISSNLYDKIPKCVFENFGKLECLDVTNNPEIQNFNPPLCSHNLKKFHSKRNNNFSFPSWMFDGHLKKMEEFELEACPINMQDVAAFNTSGDQISLDKLTLRDCLISDKQLAAILLRIKNLTHLDVSNTDRLFSQQFHNFFLQFPLQAVVTPEFLLDLNISHTGISRVPSTISNLKNLRVLRLMKNNISWLPDEICLLEQLETLVISSNPLIMFPDKIGSMKALRILEFAYCSVKTLPESFAELKKLELLDLYSNEFDEIPEGLKKMTQLQGLDLEQNSIQTQNIEDCFGASELAYATMRNIMRDSVGVYSSRLLGPIGETSAHEYEREYSSSPSSWSSMSTESISTLVDDGKADDNSEEDWDNSILFHDFDPSDITPMYHPKKFVCPTRNIHYFCPADLLPPPIMHQIVQERRNGLIPNIPEIVEGQFDDAEEDEG